MRSSWRRGQLRAVAYMKDARGKGGEWNARALLYRRAVDAKEKLARPVKNGGIVLIDPPVIAENNRAQLLSAGQGDGWGNRVHSARQFTAYPARLKILDLCSLVQRNAVRREPYTLGIG